MIAFYRGLGFFTTGAFDRCSDAACQRLVEGPHAKWYQERFQEILPHGEAGLFELEAFALWADKDRVWVQDAEWVHGDTFFYQEAIRRLGRISRNLFHPENAHETWGLSGEVEGEGDIVHVSFDALEMNHRLWIWQTSDIGNPGIVTTVNALLPADGPQFHILGSDQDWVVICLTGLELQALLRRGHTCRDISNIYGLLQYPKTTVIDHPYPRDR